MNRSKKIPEDMVKGTRFNTKSSGYLVIHDYNNSTDVMVMFESTGFLQKATSGNIRNGEVKDPMRPSVFGVGYFGVGRFKSKVKGKFTPEYSSWLHMLSRCYCSKYQSKQPTYIGCKVCDEWHNFQTFAEWFSVNHPKDGLEYQLDKDILIKGNKTYSPMACKFVSRQENTEAAKATEWVFISPKGEIVNIYNLRKFCRENKLDQGSMVNVHKGIRNHHKGWSK